jgi:hypothetical protein
VPGDHLVEAATGSALPVDDDDAVVLTAQHREPGVDILHDAAGVQVVQSRDPVHVDRQGKAPDHLDDVLGQGAARQDRDPGPRRGVLAEVIGAHHRRLSACLGAAGGLCTGHTHRDPTTAASGTTPARGASFASITTSTGTPVAGYPVVRDRAPLPAQDRLPGSPTQQAPAAVGRTRAGFGPNDCRSAGGVATVCAEGDRPIPRGRLGPTDREVSGERVCELHRRDGRWREVLPGVRDVDGSSLVPVLRCPWRERQLLR